MVEEEISLGKRSSIWRMSYRIRGIKQVVRKVSPKGGKLRDEEGSGSRHVNLLKTEGASCSKITPTNSLVHSSRTDYLPSQIIFPHRLSSRTDDLPSQIIFPHRLSSLTDYLPSQIIFPHRLSSHTDYLPAQIIFPHRLSSLTDYLPSHIIFPHRLSSLTDYFPAQIIRLPLKIRAKYSPN